MMTGQGSAFGKGDANRLGRGFDQADGGTRLAYGRLVAEARRSIVELSPKALRCWLKKGAVLIDVRESDEFELAHLEGAIHIDRAELGMVVDQLVPNLTTPIVCCCARGNRSAIAAYQLQQMGYSKVGSLRDGLNQWDQDQSVRRSKESGLELLGQAQ